MQGKEAVIESVLIATALLAVAMTLASCGTTSQPIDGAASNKPEGIVLDFLKQHVQGDAHFPEAERVVDVSKCQPRDANSTEQVFGCTWIVSNNLNGRGTYRNDFRISQGKVTEMYNWTSLDPTPLAGCGAFALGREPVLPLALNSDQQERNEKIKASWSKCR